MVGRLWVVCGPTGLAARPGLQSESNFRLRCYRPPILFGPKTGFREDEDVADAIRSQT